MSPILYSDDRRELSSLVSVLILGGTRGALQIMGSCFFFSRCVGRFKAYLHKTNWGSSKGYVRRTSWGTCTAYVCS